MKKITVNLHPLKEKNGNKIFKIVAGYIPFIFLGGVALTAINILLFIMVSFMTISHNNINNKLKNLSEKLNEVDSLKKELESLSNERKGYSRPLTENVLFSHIFTDIFESLPKNIWIDAIKFDGKNINLSGYIVEWKENPFASLERFIKNLSSEDYFSTIFKNITPPIYKVTKRVNLSVGEFKIECKK